MKKRHVYEKNGPTARIVGVLFFCVVLPASGCRFDRSGISGSLQDDGSVVVDALVGDAQVQQPDGSDGGYVPVCGNGITDPGEACDDNNTEGGDGCSADCLSDETCGNGITDPWEACDDNNTEGGDGCSADCLSDETCGNGITDPGEACDDENTESGDGCSADCLSDETCGNGITDVGEACDDGNTESGDGCSADCLSDETCGNGITDVGEACDDGNTNDEDACRNDCSFHSDCTVASYSGRIYLFCDFRERWSDALSFCRQLRFELVFIADSAEQTFVCSTAHSISNQAWWIGANDRAQEGAWVWSDGSQILYDGWANNEPNDYWGEDCGVLNSDDECRWNDVDCDDNNRFICKGG